MLSSVQVAERRFKITLWMFQPNAIRPSPSLNNMGEGLINSWSFLFRPTPLASINKTTAVWASQDYIRVYDGYIGNSYKQGVGNEFTKGFHNSNWDSLIGYYPWLFFPSPVEVAPSWNPSPIGLKQD